MPKVARPRKSLPNALKHGAYSNIDLLPGENPAEYEKLQAKMRAIYSPVGPLEEDCIDTIVRAMWRKRRVAQWRRLQTMSPHQVDSAGTFPAKPNPVPFFDAAADAFYHKGGRTPHDPTEIHTRGIQEKSHAAGELLNFTNRLHGELNEHSLKLHIEFLREGFQAHLREKTPRANYPNAYEWVKAVKREVDDVMLPQAWEEAREVIGAPAEEHARNPDLSAGVDLMTPERIMEDIDLEQRLDAEIDKAMRRFVQARYLRETTTQPARRGTVPLLIESSVATTKDCQSRK